MLLAQRSDLPAGFLNVRWLPFVLFSLLMKGPPGCGFIPRQTRSLVGIADVAAILLFGPAGGAWVASSASLLYQVECALAARLGSSGEGRSRSLPLLAADALFEAGLKVWLALAAGWLYALAGGPTPLQRIELTLIWPVGLLFSAWFLLDNAGWAGAEAFLTGWRSLRGWLKDVLSSSLLIELAPLPLSLVVVIIYHDYLEKDPLFTALVGIGLIGTSYVVQLLVASMEKQRRVVRELALLNQVAQAIVQAELSVEGLAELIYEQACRVVDAPTFYLGLFERDLFDVKLFVREGVRQDSSALAISPDEGVAGWVRQSGRPLLVGDFSKQDLPTQPVPLSGRPSLSAIYVPLMAGSQVIGTLSIQHPQPNAFSQGDLRILSFIAGQAAIAIEKARLFQAAQERAEELARIAQENADLYSQVREERDRLELLYKVTRDLTRELDLEELLHRLLQGAAESVRAEHGTILLLGARRESPRAISLQGEPDADVETLLEQGLAGWVVQEMEGALIPNVNQDPRWLPVKHPVGSAIAVPILHGETAWGAMTMTHSEEAFFTPADLSLLRAIAEQASVALEATHLYETQRRRAVQLQTVSEVMGNILSILDLDDLLAEVVHLVRERFGYGHVHIFTLDDAGEQVILSAGTDPQNPFWQARGGRLPLDEGLVGWVARQGEAAIVGDIRQDPRFLSDHADVLSEMAVPLRVSGEVVGVLDVQSEQMEAFDEEDEFILHTLADQIAMALESARLYAAEQEEAWVLNALLQVAQNIAGARDLDELLEVVVRLVPLLVGVERCVLLLRDWDEGVFEAIHGYGVQQEALDAMRFGPGEAPVLDRVAEQARPVALVARNEGGSLPAAMWDTLGGGTVWLFPLLTGGEVSSVLVLGLDLPGQHLGSRQHTILSGITHQAGIAIEEARLRGQAAEQQRLEQELDLAREIQKRLLPEQGPQLPGWSIEVAWQAARQVGGDFYDFISLPDGRLGIVIADVSDKGVPAALFMTLSRSLVRASAVSHVSPAEALERANRLLLEDTASEMFVSVFYGIIDPSTGELRYASAGHNPPLLCRGKEGPSEQLEAPGIILGIIEDVHLEERSVQMEAGDTLILYTDGVTEAINAEEEQFGEERLRTFTCAGRTQDLATLRRSLLAAVEEFCQGQPPFDDITLVLVRREPPA